MLCKLKQLPYSRKYWRSFNLAVWPKTERKKYWRNLNLAVVPRSVLRHHKHCAHVAVLSFEILELSHEFTENITGSVLAPSQLYVQLAQRDAGWSQNHYCMQLRTLLHVVGETDFNLAVSTQTAKPPNLIPHQIFWLYGMCTHGLQSILRILPHTVHVVYIPKILKFSRRNMIVVQLTPTLPSFPSFHMRCTNRPKGTVQVHNQRYCQWELVLLSG